jgi:hypothetical protein
MAVTSNTFTGNGSTTNYSFTFEYLEQEEVKVTLDGTASTAFTFANATTLSFTTAPANGVTIRIFRDTNISSLKATFFPGSAIKAEDLNANFTQNNFATQETDNEVITANTTAASAVTTANSAVTTANAATTTANNAVTTANSTIATANTANTNASAAVATANTASTNATNAVTTANTASTNASSAVTTANSAATDAAAATTAANTATTAANAATTAAQAAQADANTATATANSATTTANTAVTTANAATATANTADTNATAAVTTANAASATANAASAAVSAAAFYTPIAALANLPASPANEDRVEVVNSTGVESNSAVSGVPTGFVGSTDLTIRLQYNSSTSKWAWQQYFAADPENRYLTQSLPVVKGDSTNGAGQLTLNCENNSHGVKIKGPPHSAGANYTLTLPNDTGANGQALTTNGGGVLSFADIASSIITQTDFAYKPSSNTATLAGPSSSTNPTGYNQYIGIHSSGNAIIRFEKSTNLQFYNLINQLSSGDSIDVNWNNAGTQRTDTTTFHSLTDNTISGVLYGELSVNSSLGTFGIGSYPFAVTSTNIINGTEPIANNQVLRYKTATNKWTVDDAEVIAIVDGGNFTTGGSLVQTSTTFDGGSF